MNKWHIFHHTVLFRECDASGHIHNSNYFRWFEDARFELSRQIGLVDAFGNPDDLYFPVLESKCKFTIPIKIGSNIVIKTRLEPPKVAKFTFTHIVMNETGSKYAEGTTAIGVVSKTRGLIINLDNNVKKLISDYLKN